MDDRRNEVSETFSAGVGVRPFVRDAAVAVVFSVASIAMVPLAFIWGGLWLVVVAVVLFVFAATLAIGSWNRPTGFVFDRNSLTVRCPAGLQQHRLDRLDEIVSFPAGPQPRLILKFSDGEQVVIPQTQIQGTIDELGGVLKQRLAPWIVKTPWPRSQDRLTSPRAFGPGSVRPFSAYLERPSLVDVSSVDDVVEWLQQCEFVTDEELFGRDDVWQHPVAFEQERKGDCEDHALWAWRKLVELGMKAEFVVGSWKDMPHAWVNFERDGEVFLFETSAKQGEMIFPANEILDTYRPRLGVNRHLVTYRYQEDGGDLP